MGSVIYQFLLKFWEDVATRLSKSLPRVWITPSALMVLRTKREPSKEDPQGRDAAPVRKPPNNSAACRFCCVSKSQLLPIRALSTRAAPAIVEAYDFKTNPRLFRAWISAPHFRQTRDTNFTNLHQLVRALKIRDGFLQFVCSRLLFVAQFLETRIGAQRVPDGIEPKKGRCNRCQAVNEGFVGRL